MKKTIICNIPMKEKVEQVVYSSDDKSLPVSDCKVRYPICAFLEKTMEPKDKINAILLVKKDNYGYYKKNTEWFQEELTAANANIGANITFSMIATDFEESRSVHEQLMGRLVDKLDVGTHILADITYGPKDLPIVVFAALHFAENFLDCTIDNIIYGQASFADGKVVDPKICDMIPLYCLESISNTIRCTEPEKARSMLQALLSL